MVTELHILYIHTTSNLVVHEVHESVLDSVANFIWSKFTFHFDKREILEKWLYKCLYIESGVRNEYLRAGKKLNIEPMLNIF